MIFVEFGVNVSTSTVARHLNNKLFTLKKTTNVPVGANSDENKRQRRFYVEEILKLTLDDEIIFYQNESNNNLFCRATRSRSRSGQRAHSPNLPNSRGPNVHYIGLYSSIHFYFIRKQETFIF